LPWKMESDRDLERSALVLPGLSIAKLEEGTRLRNKQGKSVREIKR